MKLQYVKEAAVDELRRAVVSNESKYKADSPWIQDFFSGRQFLAESRLEVEGLPELRVPNSSGTLFELENAIALHSALRDLSPSQAADERLWVWLAHEHYWEYMRKRWSVEGKNLRSYVLEHYFLGDARTLVRHGLARLWWFGFSTYDPNASDPYGLTKMLLHTTDARQSLMERKFWRNRTVLRGLLQRVAYWQDNQLDFYVPRERFRRLCKTFNVFGGTMLLDALEEGEIFSLVDEIATAEMTNATASAD